jgi:hypothetical protein
MTAWKKEWRRLKDRHLDKDNKCHLHSRIILASTCQIELIKEVLMFPLSLLEEQEAVLLTPIQALRMLQSTAQLEASDQVLITSQCLMQVPPAKQKWIVTTVVNMLTLFQLSMLSTYSNNKKTLIRPFLLEEIIGLNRYLNNHVTRASIITDVHLHRDNIMMKTIIMRINNMMQM